MSKASLFVCVLLLSVSVSRGLQLRELGFVPEGCYVAEKRIVLCDSDHDSLGELVFASFPPPRWSVWEYRSVNRFHLVQADTGMNNPDTIYVGNFVPSEAGDVDGDGRTDIVGWLGFGAGGRGYCANTVVESSTATSHPHDYIWRSESTSTHTVSVRFYADLDQDSAREVVTAGTRVYECVGDDSLELVYSDFPSYPKVWGDFDQNGRKDLVGSYGSMLFVLECTGDNQYALVCSLRTGLPNPQDCFTGRDADRNGQPEFFVTFARYGAASAVLYLLQFETAAERDYRFYLLDSFRLAGAEPSDQRGLCADLDGDGAEEVIWSCVSHVVVLASLGPHAYERVADWPNAHGQYPVSLCNAADFNRNGYNELYVGGYDRVSMLEVEAVRLLAPDGGEELAAGDTCVIRWQTFTPPRCDSVALFLLTDTVVPGDEWFWNLDTIVTGLAPEESSYAWVVPDTVLEAGWVVAIAYGPGWQFDRSDEPFRIVPAAIEEAGPSAWERWDPPTVLSGVVRVPAGVSADLLDVCGRKVFVLLPGLNDIRRLAPGVYFLRPAASRSPSAVQKVIVQR